jgi:four helix bundle protein
MSLRSYRDLEVWRIAFRLALEAHRIATRLPGHELYGLASQIRRAATSIPANIAEGYGRAHRGDYLRHLSFASGSLKELETHILLARALAYLTREETNAILARCSSVGRMLTNLRRALLS